MLTGWRAVGYEVLSSRSLFEAKWLQLLAEATALLEAVYICRKLSTGLACSYRPVAFVKQPELLSEDTLVLRPFDHLALDGPERHQVVELGADSDERAVRKRSVDVAHIDALTLTDEANSSNLAASCFQLLQGEDLRVVDHLVVVSAVDEAVGLNDAVAALVVDGSGSGAVHGVLISFSRWWEAATISWCVFSVIQMFRRDVRRS